MQDLKQKKEYIYSLESELADVKSSKKKLEQEMPVSERELKEKYIVMEKNLENLTMLYH